MSGDFSTIMASGVQGSIQGSGRSGETSEASSRMSALDRLTESRQRAEKSAEAGAVENESQKASADREGDGRFLRSFERLDGITDKNNRSGATEAGGSIDLSGKVGKNLDFFG